MLGKIFLAIASKYAQTSVKRSRFSNRCEEDHKRKVPTTLYITCKMEEFLSLNILSFLHSHDQIKAIDPTLICFLNPFPKILVIMHGGNKVEATWMTDHIDLAK
jgi:hypothetical protein